MGKINNERKIKFPYPPKIIEGWNSLTPEQRAQFNEFGKPYGYSGMNVLVLSVMQRGGIEFGDANQSLYYYRRGKGLT